jgi:WD40 repeat protein
LQRWELATKKPLYPNIAARGHLQTVASLALSSDGKTLVGADKSGDLHFWDPRTSRLIRVVHKINAAALAFSPDGKRLHVVTPDKSLLVCDPGSGKVLDKWALYGLPVEVPGIDGMTISDENKLVINQCDPGSFTPNTRLALPAPGGVTAEWDIKTGKRLWFRTLEGEAAYLALSPDGRQGVDWALNLREAKSGRLVSHLGGKDDRDYVLPSGIFSPDGSLIATETHRLSSAAKSTDEAKYTGVKIWESATCRMLQRLPLHVSGQLAFAPDGRRVAILRADQLWIWDIVGGKELLHLQAPVSAAYWRGTRLTFAPNGRGLVVATDDGSMLLFAVPPITSAGLANMTEAQMRTTWETLADPDPAKAFAAAADLADRPNQGVPFLNDRLKLAVPIPAEEIRKLIAALDADTFAVRQAAQHKLAALGSRAWPALRMTLKQRPSLEASRRMERLLEAENSPPSGDVLRKQRALRVLEWAGTAQARDLLESLAAGDPAAPLTRDAKAALRRLEGTRR